MISSYPERAKLHNLRRTPQAAVLVLSDDFGGAWVQVDGPAEVLDMPSTEAEDGLVEYFRCISGEHPDWDEYRAAMRTQGKSLIRVTPQPLGPDRDRRLPRPPRELSRDSPGPQCLGDHAKLNLALRDRSDELITDLRGRHAHILAVENEEQSHAHPGQPLIPVDQRMVASERLHQGGGLEPQVRIGVRAKCACLRPCERRLEQPNIAHDRLGRTHRRVGGCDEVFESEVDRHLASRSSSAASSVTMRARISSRAFVRSAT